MPDTAALQAAFARAMTSRDVDAADLRLLRGPAPRLRRRLGFYRGNVQANARKALRNAYPVCERLVGEDFFAATARAFMQAHPSTSGDLNAYGSEFAAFLRDFEPAGSLPYLPDVALLEWHVHRAHYAADRAPLDLREVASVSPERFTELRALLHPACALVATRTAAVAIWLAHQPGSDGAFAVDPQGGPQRALVHRPLFRVEVVGLEPAPFAFLRTCAAGATLDDATRAAVAADGAFALDAHLAGWVRDRVIVELALP